MATLVIYFILKDVLNLDRKIGSKRYNDNICELEVTLNRVLNDKNEINIVLNTIAQKEYKVLNTNINAEDKSNVIIHMTMSLPPNKVYNEIFADLLQLDYVKTVNMY